MKTFQKGDVIFRQGDPAGSMYSILSGRVGVFTDYGTPHEKQVAELKKDDVFGEMGLIENEPRSATVAALEDETSVDEVSEDSFLSFFENDPDRVFEIMRQLSSRLRKTTEDYLETCRAISDVVDLEDETPDAELAARLATIHNDYQAFNMANMGNSFTYMH